MEAAMVRQAAAEVTTRGRARLSPRGLALFAPALVLVAAFVAALALPHTLRAPSEAPEATASKMGGPAPSGLTSPLPSPAAPPPAADSARFESLLLATPREASLNAALRRITGPWGDPQLERTSLVSGPAKRSSSGATPRDSSEPPRGPPSGRGTRWRAWVTAATP